MIFDWFKKKAVESKKLFNPQIGEIWGFDREHDPWKDTAFRVKIVDLKGDWIRYTFESSTTKGVYCTDEKYFHAKSRVDFLFIFEPWGDK